ncbi:MAG TPA: hypothetical protein VK256_09015 [Candidatus Eisenbacteria bacterium]|nr:hypothetical protein [Candidatus Eisenbacteria bacterium]
MTEQTPNPNPADVPVDPLSTHPASPFLRTEAPTPVAFGSPPNQTPTAPIYSTWVTYRTQIQFGLTLLAYLMVLVGSVNVLQANPEAAWRYYVALLPVIPAGLVIWVFMRTVSRLDEVQKRIQVQAFGFAIGATALLTFGYGFLEGAGMPRLSWIYVLPLMVVLWAVGVAMFMWRHR